MEEIWKDVVGYEGLYQVSNIGALKSLAKTVRGKSNSRVFRKERIISQGKSSCGYLIVSLSKNGKKVNKLMHRLVCIAFLNNADNKPCVNHIDSNRHNNNITNLEWCTYSENGKHAFLNGRNKQVHGEANVLSKHTEEFVLKIRSMKGMYTQYEIARLMGTNQGTVSDILLRKTWKHI